MGIDARATGHGPRATGAGPIVSPAGYPVHGERLRGTVGELDPMGHGSCSCDSGRITGAREGLISLSGTTYQYGPVFCVGIIPIQVAGSFLLNILSITWWVNPPGRRVLQAA